YCKMCSRRRAQRRCARMRRRRPEEISIPITKCCSHCQIIKVAEEFWTDKTQADGLSRQCHDCRSIAGRLSYERHKASRISQIRFRRYGLSESDGLRMLQKQNNTCPVCGAVFGRGKRFVVDHDHETGVVRGLLCDRCNTALGLLGDSLSRLRAAE